MKKYLLMTMGLMLMSGNVWAECNSASGETEGINCWKCGDDCDIKLKNGTLAVTGSGKMYDYDYIRGGDWVSTAPWLSVRDDIKRVEINGIETLGRDTFTGLRNLDYVKVGNSVKTLGYDSFLNVQNVKDFILPDSLETMGAWALQKVSAENLIMPDSIKSINPTTFDKASFQNVVCSGGGNTTKCDAVLKQGGKNIQSVSRPNYKLDENGKIVERYAYDEAGNLIRTYDSDGNLIATYGYDNNGKRYLLTADGKLSLKNADGSTSIYNKDGEFISIRGKKIYTVEEAEAVTAHGDKFHVRLTYK